MVLRTTVLQSLAGAAATTELQWTVGKSFPATANAHPPPRFPTNDCQLSLLPEEDPSHQQHELWLADAYNRAGRYAEAVRQYRQLLLHASEDEGHLVEERVELLCRLADIQVWFIQAGWLGLMEGS